MLLSQIIPESEKNIDWCKANIDRLCAAVYSSVGFRSKDELCYRLYYAMQDESDFEYLTGKDEYRMPARVRFMPIARPFFDLLQATQETQPLNPNVYAVDVGSLTEKHEALANRIVDTVLRKTNEAQSRLQVLQMQLDSRSQMIQQAGQQGGVDPMELQMAQIQLQQVQEEVSRGSSILDETLREMEHEHSKSAKTMREEAMSEGLAYLMQKYRWKELFDQGFVDLMIVDQEVYCIEDVQVGRDPSIRRVNPQFFFYLSSMDATYTDEVPAVVEKRWMPPSQVLDEFGHLMSEEDRQKVNKSLGGFYPATIPPGYYTGGQTSFSEVPHGSTENCDSGELYSGSSIYSSNLIEISYVEWHSVRELHFVEEDDENGISQIRLVTDGDGGPDGKKDASKKWHRRYINEVWGGVRIGRDVYVKMGKLPFQHRDVDKIGKAYGRYISFAYNGMDKRPYSRVWAVKDVQILYNLVYYQMELLIAMSGLKGVIMDKSQKPRDMAMDDWLKEFKQGIAWIDPTQPNLNGGRPSTYNQFGTYDLSFGQSIQQCLGMLSSLEHLCGRIIGIPPQRLGEVLQNDQVGTHKAAIAQSNLTTKVLFNKHRRLIGRVLNRVSNVCTHAWKEGFRGQYVHGQMGQRVFKIAADSLKGAKFEVFFDQDGLGEELLEQAQSAIVSAFQTGNVSLEQMIRSMQARSIGELEDAVSHYTKLAERRAQEREQSVARNEQETAKIEAEMRIMEKKALTEGENLKAQIEQMRMNLEAQIAQADAQTKLAIAGMSSETKRYEVDKETQVEAAYLQEQSRKASIDARLKAIELTLKGAVSGGSSLSSGRPKADVSDR